ncbi:MAG: TatD family hydrolase [Saprospiraceae bacterium]|jgi:TatD DNase family protein|nr:TatD family hydrolase [Saprospiraceae bacterium]
MTMLIDTHTHLYLNQFDKDRDETIQRAIESGVEQFFLPNIDSETIDSMFQLEAKYPERCFAMMGLHPCSVKENYKEELAIAKEWLDKRPFCAVGEIGIDLYWDKSFFEQQKEAFLTQIEWAKALDLPIVIHSREATDIIIELLEEVKDQKLRGIFHCFGGSLEQANKIIDLGFYLGIGGVLTFKKSGLDKVIPHVPLERIVLETDSPYLAPTPFRGKRNESAYVRLVAEKLTTVTGVTFKEISKITSKNALNIFNKKEFGTTTKEKNSIIEAG